MIRRHTGPTTPWSQGLLEGAVREAPPPGVPHARDCHPGRRNRSVLRGAVARVSPRGVSVKADDPTQSMSSSPPCSRTRSGRVRRSWGAWWCRRTSVRTRRRPTRRPGRRRSGRAARSPLPGRSRWTGGTTRRLPRCRVWGDGGRVLRAVLASDGAALPVGPGGGFPRGRGAATTPGRSAGWPYPPGNGPDQPGGALRLTAGRFLACRAGARRDLGMRAAQGWLGEI